MVASGPGGNRVPEKTIAHPGEYATGGMRSGGTNGAGSTVEPARLDQRSTMRFCGRPYDGRAACHT
jgi:hypothetical protein